MPDKPEGPDTTAPAAKPGQGAEPPETLKALLERERQARLATEQERDNLRTAFNRRDAEIRQLREMAEQRRQVYGTADDAPRYSPEVEALRQRLDSIQQGFDYYRFRADHPDAADASLWQDVQALVNDPNRVGEVAAFIPGVVGPDGQPVADVYKTLRNAMREVQYQRLTSKRSTTEQATNAANAASEANRRAAAISGNATAAEEPQIDLTNASADDLLKLAQKAGLVDPNDLPASLRR